MVGLRYGRFAHGSRGDQEEYNEKEDAYGGAVDQDSDTSVLLLFAHEILQTVVKNPFSVAKK
jgi:hypothetical protein